MNAITTFDSTKELLLDILENIQEGKTQLPDFQRGWIDGGNEPSTIADANFVPARLHTLRTRNSAAYKGLYALLMRDGAHDFRTGDPIDVQMYFDDKIDIHHIFPQDWCKKSINDPKFKDWIDSIVNKTPLAARTNRMIGNSPPSIYLSRIQKNAVIDDARMDEILHSHVIEPEFLRSDDFAAFFSVRETSLLERIEKAMGKPILWEMMGKDIDIIEDYHVEEE